MEAMTIYNRQEIVPAQQFNPALFNDFVEWINRSEKTTRSYLTNLKQFMAWLKYTAIRNPIRADIISYRQWLTAEHDAIRLDPGSADGWTYRTDANGTPLKITCAANTIAHAVFADCMPIFPLDSCKQPLPRHCGKYPRPQVEERHAPQRGIDR